MQPRTEQGCCCGGPAISGSRLQAGEEYDLIQPPYCCNNEMPVTVDGEDVTYRCKRCGVTVRTVGDVVIGISA